MRKVIMLVAAMLVIQFSLAQDNVLDISAKQSMLIIGKGAGQDAAINPYKDIDSYAVIKNIGKDNFEVRVQSKGKIVEIIEVKPSETKRIFLNLGYELYLDTEVDGKAKVDFEPKL